MSRGINGTIISTVAINQQERNVNDAQRFEAARRRINRYLRARADDETVIWTLMYLERTKKLDAQESALRDDLCKIGYTF